jgi:hypothetical protein
MGIERVGAPGKPEMQPVQVEVEAATFNTAQIAPIR